MDIALDFRSDTPLYEQICIQIRQLIMTGILKPGEQLPTIRGLASKLGINFNTVARSYRLLDAEGLVSTQHGRGTFILGSSEHRNTAPQREDSFRRLTRAYLAKNMELGYSYDELKTLFLAYLEDLEEQ